MKKFILFLNIVFIIVIFQLNSEGVFASTVSDMADVNVKIGKSAEGYMQDGESNTFIFKPNKIGKLKITINCYVNDMISASLYSDYNTDTAMIIGETYDEEKGFAKMTYEVLVGPRTYYLKLTNPIVINRGNIHVTTEFKETKSVESSYRNNTASGAVTLLNDKYYHGVLAFDETDDYYVFNLKKKQTLKITVTSKTDESTIVIVKNSKGEELAKDFIYGKTRIFTFDKKLSAGKYYLIINKGSQIHQSGRAYEISTGNYKPITKVSLPKTKTIYIGDVYNIKPQITPNDAMERYSYSSSNTKIAKVSASGKITALKKGTATITLTTEEGKIKKTCKITVKEVAAKSIKLSRNNISLKEGESVELTATISPQNASSKKVSWSSSDKKVAIVSSSGGVTAQGAGTCNITAEVGNVSASCLIKVPAKRVVDPTPTPKAKAAEESDIEVVEVKGISMLSSLNMYLGKTKSVNDLMAVVTPDNASDKTLSWSSTDNSIVSIEGGLITSKKVGTARVVVTSKNGKKAYCTVIIKESE